MVPSGETALHLSAQQPACCELLLSCGAEAEERDATLAAGAVIGD